MPKVTLVKPTKGSGRFVDDNTAKLITTTRDSGGREIVKRSGIFSGERFPRSKQFTRPYYSASKRMWMVDLSDEELNKLVKECRFEYPESHHMNGYIETADRRNFRDPFFRHERLNHLMEEGEAALRDDDPIMQVVLAGMRLNPEFQVGDADGPMSMRVKYQITDKTISTAIESKDLEEKDRAVQQLKNLTYEERLKVARALYLPVGSKVEPDDLQLMLRRGIEENKAIGEQKNQTFRQAFLLACQLPKEQLNMKDLIQRARRASIIRKKKDGYEFMGTFIGKRLDAVEQYFSDPTHDEFLIQLERLLDEAESVE